MAKGDSKRPYRKRKRARLEEETRRRITEAAVELHETVGPAQTRVTEVARRAGVSRMTVYNHFPTDAELFAACSNHWVTENPFPDSSTWSEVADPAARLRAALEELYGWYARNQGMLDNVFRDAPRLESFGELVKGMWDEYYEKGVAVLADGWETEPAKEAELRAVLRLVMDFHTWKVLADAGPEEPGPAQVAAKMVL